MKRNPFRIMACGVVITGAGVAQGGALLRLSEFSSDHTPAEQLDATLEFTVTGSTLTLSVTNETAAPASFDISAVYFNGLSHIDDLSLTSAPDGWVIDLQEHADGFGVFDFGLLSELGNDPAEIGPGESVDFEFTVSGTAPFFDTDFTRQLSSIPPGNRPSLAAIKFINGPGDDSAFGSVVIPEPATLALLGIGAGVLACKSRRVRVR